MCLSGSNFLEQGYCTDENNKITESKINAMLCGKQSTGNFADQMETVLKIIRWKVSFVNITTWHGLVHSHKSNSFSVIQTVVLAFVILGSKYYIENFTLMSQVRKRGRANANTTGTVLKVQGLLSSGVSNLGLWAKSGPLCLFPYGLLMLRIVFILNWLGEKKEYLVPHKRNYMKCLCLDVYK